MSHARSLVSVPAVALLVAFAIGAGSPQGAAASTSLVITAPGFSALKLAHYSSSAYAAKRTLALGLPRRVVGAIGSASAQASGASAHGERVDSDAFVFRTKAVAASVVHAWRTAHHAGKVTVGGGGAVAIGHGRGQAEVLWRDGARLGLIVLRAKHARPTARAAAVSLALQADLYLRSRLPQTAWQKVLNQIRPNGTASRRTALQAFVVAYGRLPGVKVPKGPRGTAPSGTLAAQWILKYQSSLSPVQRRAVDVLLGLNSKGTAHAAEYGDPTFHPDGGIEAIANGFAATEGADLGHTLGLTIVAGYSDQASAAYADTLPLNANGTYGSGPATTCRIRVLPADQAASVAFLRLTIAHEVFHCFEFDLRGAKVWTPLPAWIGEGAADWAALTVDPVSYSLGGANLSNYIASPTTPLFSRSYDAVGFWGHVQDTIGGLWTRFAAIFNASGNAAAYDAAGADSEAFLNSWASSPFLITGAGPAWNMASPINAAAGTAAAPVEKIYPEAVVDVAASPYTTAQYEVESDSSKPLLYVSVSGHARLGSTTDYTDLEGAWFCTDIEGCTCPKGTSGDLPPTRPLPPEAAFGLTGDPADGSRALLAAYPLSQYCKPASPPGGGLGGAGGGGAGVGGDDGSAGSMGDPHLLDFAGALFDFQQAGEFTLLKSTTDDLEVQVRQQPFPHSRTVAINTAVAVRSRGAVFEIALGHHRVIAYIDHRPVAVGTHKVRGARFTVTSQEGILTTHDGTTVTISDDPTDSLESTRITPALEVFMNLSRHRRRHLTGLLGNWGVASSNEFAGGDGRRYSAEAIAGNTPASDAILYGRFGRSWRITQRESLFVYPRGKSTNSYNVRGFPTANETEADLPHRSLAAGERACQGVGGADLQVFGACVVDVGVTGDRNFAAADAAIAKKAGVTGAGKTPLHPIDLGPGSVRPVAAYDPISKTTYVAWIDDAKSAIDLCAVSADANSCNNGAGPYALTDPLADISGYQGLYYSVGVVVLPDGTVAVVGEIEGANGAVEPVGYANASGSVVWASPAGGAAFATPAEGIVDGGQILSEAVGRTPSGGAIALDATHIAVYGDSFGSGFSDFTLGEPAPVTTPTPDQTGDFSAQPGVESGQVASIPDPGAPGQFIVVAVGGDDGTAPGCPAGSARSTGFGVGIGTPAVLSTQPAWGARGFATLRCNAYSPVLAGGGTSGGTIGLLEDEGSLQPGSDSSGIYYRRFNPSILAFGSPVLVSVETKFTVNGAAPLSLSADASGGLYAAWADSRGVLISDSASGGTKWTVPVTIALKGFVDGYNDDSVLGVGMGAAEMVYTAGTGNNTHVYLARVDATTGGGVG